MVLFTPVKIQRYTGKSNLTVWNKMVSYCVTAMIFKDSLQTIAKDKSTSSLY